MKYAIGLTAVAVTSLLAGCGTNAGQARTGKVQSPTSSHELQFKAADGKTVSVNPNQKTILYFMSPSCGSCVAGEKRFAKDRSQIHAKLISIDVQGFNTPKEIQNFKHSVGANWTHVIDKQSKWVNHFKIQSLDTVIVLYHHKQIYKGIAPSLQKIQKVIST
ncbi:hypothetical protein [Alicyclobacillus sp. SO9]|uniref:TlpA family protein disulfide reductase n=1 Tax=Alicyclobacillus sp. SO9 TaxID=2665646 RepID=UPI0018E7468D|nr:hypothetical protein [Alicyclobacillus sp. SO9]QQE79997.1 hypothetical protein GI364_05865 [Alicyclobacillus sp. SO9]